MAHVPSRVGKLCVGEAAGVAEALAATELAPGFVEGCGPGV